MNKRDATISATQKAFQDSKDSKGSKASKGSKGSTRRVPLTVLISLLALRTVLLLVGDGVTYGIAKAFNPDATLASVLLDSNVFVVAVDIITVAVLALALRGEGKTLRTLFDRFRFSDISWGLLLFIIGMVGFFVATYIGNLIVYQGPPPVPVGPMPSVPLWLALWSIIVLPVTVAIAEESLYRGYLQSRLTARFGLWAGLLNPCPLFRPAAHGVQPHDTPVGGGARHHHNPGRCDVRCVLPVAQTSRPVDHRPLADRHRRPRTSPTFDCPVMPKHSERSRND